MTQYSDEIINAYVDDELSGSEKNQIKQDIEINKELADKVHALCALKKSLKFSYSQIPLPGSAVESRPNLYPLNFKSVIIAVLILCSGIFLGSSLNGFQVQTNYANNEELKGIKLTPIKFYEPNKIILHVSSSDAGVLYNTLFKINLILEKYKENKIPFELEVVANSSGIDFLRKDVSPYKDRIKEIMKNYNNVSFIACSNAIEKLRLKGVEPQLIADTKLGLTAIEQIVKRLQEGWVYLKV